MDKNVLLNALAEVLAEKMDSGNKAQYKHDLPAGFTLSTNLMHGPTGIFGVAGVGPDIFSSRIVPRGLLSVLPSVPSVDTHPIVGYLTGFTATTGNEPSAPCAECVKPGNIKACYQGSRFGLVCRETDELDISKVGQHVNRSEYFDLRLVNDPILADSPNWVPASIPKNMQTALNSEVMARWITLGAAFEQVLARLVWTGNPANNVGTGYAEPLGLQSLVSTGHTDVLDGTHCPSLDSDIKDFNHADIENNAAGLFDMMTYLYRYVKHNAEGMGFMPVQWAFVIKDSLFRKLADYWPCVYASFMCGANALQLNNNTDAMTMRARSDDMYTNKWLEIDGERIPVIVDDAIPYESAAQGFNMPNGTFESDIYLLPFTVRGGQRVLFMEYFDYAATNGVMQQISQGRLLGDEFFADGGMFLWTYSRTKWCVNWSAKIEPRFRLLTPQLAGRIQNVRWTPLQMFREPFTDQGYFVDGGRVTSNNAPYTISR